jgi:urease accessory protein
MTRLALAILFILSSSLTAAAHPAAAPVHDLVTGLLHPLSGLDHLTAMVALGFWAGSMRGMALWQWPLAFLLFLLFGAMFAQGLPLALFAEYVVLGSALVLVGLAVFRFRLSNAIALSVIAVSALAHGHVHGRELVVDLSEPGMPLGFIAATAALHLFGVLLAYLTSRTDVRAFRATS